VTAPLRIGLIGAGGIAGAYAELFDGVDVAQLVAVADTNFAAAQALAERVQAMPFESYTDLGEQAGVEAVIICTPPATHVEIASYFVKRRIAVLCEKPLATSTSSASALVELAQRNGVVLTMAAKFRFVDDVIRAKSIVDSGILGDIILFENAFASRVSMAGRWNADPDVSGGGVLIDNGTHSVDIVRYFLGPIAEVMAVEAKRVQNLPVEDTAQLFLRTASGVAATVDLSWSINKELDSFINVYGSQGTIRVGWRESKYRQASSPEWVVFGHGYQKLDCMRRAVENFCGAVRGTRQLLITPEEAIASVDVIDAAYQSLGRGGWVSVKGYDDHAEKPPVRRITGVA
jgi:predicted dehydrogenase